MRLAAFNRMAELNGGGTPVAWSELVYGFEFNGQRYSLLHQSGIWKPSAMPYLLSIRTGLGKDAEGYADYESGIESVLGGADHIDYSFRRGNINHAHNRQLFDAFAADVPVIYFLAAGNGSYLWAAPAYITAVDKRSETCQVVFGSPDRGPTYDMPSVDERATGISVLRERIQRWLPQYDPRELPLRMVAEDSPSG